MFDIVELQGAGNTVDDALGHTRGVTTFEADVVLGRDAGQQRDLLSSQPGDSPAIPAVAGQSGRLRGHPGTAGRQELADFGACLVTGVRRGIGGGHDTQPRSRSVDVGVPVGDSIHRDSLSWIGAGLVDFSPFLG